MAKKRERMSRCGQSVECSICSIEKLYLLKLWKCICRGPAAVRAASGLQQSKFSSWAGGGSFQLVAAVQKLSCFHSVAYNRRYCCCRYALRRSWLLSLSLCFAAMLPVASPVLTVTSVLTQFNSLGIGQRVPCGGGANLWNIEQEVSNQPVSDMSWQAKN